MERKVMLCAFGIHSGGKNEILSFRMADSEDLPSWKGFPADPKARDLLRKKTKLIVSCGNPALPKAMAETHPFSGVKRLRARRVRKMAVRLKRENRKPDMGEARLIFTAPSKKEALRRFKAWRENGSSRRSGR